MSKDKILIRCRTDVSILFRYLYTLEFVFISFKSPSF